MTISTFKFFDKTITLYEDLDNKRIIGRSIYTLSIEGEGTYIKALGDDKKEALKEYENEIRKTLS